MRRRRSPILAASLLATLALALAVVATPAYAASYKNVYRMYNVNSGEHFYTVSLDEAKGLLEQGWRWEGVGWVAPATSGTPVYRVYNPNGGDHHYTTSVEERDALVSLGWQNEEIGWYSDESSDTKGMLREYNPNAKSGAHNFTTSREEHDNLVKKEGWNDESIDGYAWFASNRRASSITPFSVQSSAWGVYQTVYVGSDATVTKRVDISFEEKRDDFVANVTWSNHGVYLNRMKALANQIGSPTEYFLACDYDLCRVTVLERKNGGWEVIKTWNSNMGGHTFKGTWHISHKSICDWDYGYFGKGYNDWASCYIESFLDHNTGHLRYVGGKGYDDGQTIHSTGYSKTGYDNYGCIGLLWENAKWVYDNAARNVKPSDQNGYHGTDQGTTVYVF